MRRAYTSRRSLPQLFQTQTRSRAFSCCSVVDMCARYEYSDQSASGTYSFLTPGMRMLDKITRIIHEEMESVSLS